MSSNSESIGKTLGVVISLCLVCAVLVSTAAVKLRPLQQENKTLDIQRNILAAAGIDGGDDIKATFSKYVETHVVNFESGEFVDSDPTKFDFEMSKFDKKISFALKEKGIEDIAGVQRMTEESPVYLVKKNGQLETIILPVQGYGLWGIMYGFLALEADTKTVRTINFYKHNETPGLGGEIQNPTWVKSWSEKELPITVVKSGAGSDKHKVDGLSGATLTSNGVGYTFDFWTSEHAFGPFLAKVREGALN